MVSINRAGDVPADNLHIGFLLYGDPGAGKTHAASLAPRPLVLLTEKNGMTTIRRANPDALVVEVSNVADLREVVGMAMRGDLPDRRRSLVVDSLTEVQRLFRDDIMASKPAGQTFSLQDWGTMAEKMRRFMRTLRDIPYHVVATALAENVTSDADGVRYVQPAFDGKKTGNEVAQYFNGVAYLFKRQAQDDDGNNVVLHQAMLDGPTRYTCKPVHPVTGVMEPRLDQWFATLANQDPNTSATGATRGEQ
jgi:hypothetical protein